MTVKSKLNVAMEFGDMEHRAYGVAHAFRLIHLLHDSDAENCDIAECVAQLADALGFEADGWLANYFLGMPLSLLVDIKADEEASLPTNKLAC